MLQKFKFTLIMALTMKNNLAGEAERDGGGLSHPQCLGHGLKVRIGTNYNVPKSFFIPIKLFEIH